MFTCIAVFRPGRPLRTLATAPEKEGANHMKIQINITRIAKASLAAATLSGFLLFAAAPAMRAGDDDNGCRNRVNKADHQLHEAAEHHGWDSPQAAQRRQQLAEAREYCWNHAHRWWDADGQRWRTDRDWDDHDHDHR